MEEIRIRGARTHNLKNLSLDLPRHRLIVITGLSGSGKSSLAFDTLYAEGQRRYVESLSAYARQFLQLMEKPDVDLIEGLSPAISIEQKATSHNPRSTVGTVTEIHDYLRLLFARVGDPYCINHPEQKLSSMTISQMVDATLAMSNTNNAQVLNNLISGNPAGGLDTLNVTPNTLIIRGNLIGTQADGTSPLPNGNFGGINLRISNATVGGSGPGQPNTIAFNNGPGIWIRLNSNSNPLVQNVIYANTLQGITLQDSVPGIPLANDPGDVDTVAGNRGQNYPVLNLPVIAAGSATISGTFNSQASKQYRIEFFANAACGSTGFGQGQTFIGNVTVVTDGSGNASIGPIVLPVPPGQSIVTATATDIATSDTSEFSQCPAAGPGTTTDVVSSLNPSTFGQSVTFTATVSGGTSPTGSVQFFDGATSLGTVALAGATAQLTTSALAVGTHSITAAYSGDADDTPSTSAPVSQVVNAAAPGVTATALVSSLNPSTVGQAVTFTATVSGGTSPTGNVQFREGATVLATVPLAGATAAFTTSALSVGVHADHRVHRRADLVTHRGEETALRLVRGFRRRPRLARLGEELRVAQRDAHAAGDRLE